MAAQTQGAVDSLLGLLTSAIKDEARLLGGVHGDVQFIKDEMDSMNGFLMHLTKTDGDHDDQLRAWMKQVRDIAYVAEDCIELYVHDLAPPDGGILAFLRYLPVYLWRAPARHRLATKIRELKLRVREVGERRLRYGVNVPATEIKEATGLPGQDESAKVIKEAFRQALDEDLLSSAGQVVASEAEEQEPGATLGRRRTDTSGCPSFSRAVSLLRNRKAPLSQETDKIDAILKACCIDDDEKLSCTKMFLCALFVYPHATSKELVSLKKKLDQGSEDAKELVRTFCYSMLSMQQKSCLQYLTAFLEEASISRTSMVRRWVAEGLVGKGQGKTTPEEEGERCFNELVFRGFVVPVRISDAGTVKSCAIDDPIREFITNMAKSENFVSELPSHLERQREIRRIVLRRRPQQQQQQQKVDISGLCCSVGSGASGPGAPPSDDPDSTTPPGFKDPMDDLVHFLKTLPEGYRLNVLDLGGCRGLKKRHLKSICKVVWLKYLCLRKTDISRLRARHLQGLRLLETLDIRDTDVRPEDIKHIFLPRLKHLLAGRHVTASASGGDTDTPVEESLCTVLMPRRIGMMKHMETLTRVRVSKDGTDLEGVAKLLHLRKLGVVVHANDDTDRYLRRVINGLAGSLRSLSIWVANNDGVLDISMEGSNAISASKLLVLENLDIKGKCDLPSWINEVKTLANITLCDTDMKGHLGALVDAPALRCLSLLNKSYSERVLTLKIGQFKALKVLVVEDTNIKSIIFQDGAAPMLEKIVWTFHEMDKEQDLHSGIRYLRNLKLIKLIGHDFDPEQLSNLKKAMAEHQNRPNLVWLSRLK